MLRAVCCVLRNYVLTEMMETLELLENSSAFLYMGSYISKSYKYVCHSLLFHLSISQNGPWYLECTVTAYMLTCRISMWTSFIMIRLTYHSMQKLTFYITMSFPRPVTISLY